ncbi:efflux RND transporter periplasmic adaptor subunit [Paremcibacter congregatus]|uniref:Efflux transporter periplasmic adaptor subunit n=1 Tax=Paremcibacter congregatus TaxID=2043170 RepID=A0A2G4YQF0_9PROT|nr:efflux RND transporter periplasmic adaptor subunit [Paremcibacter congregatus]PHZ84552.1 efflux transporter periplasmic adaptor subunit [Paremcibacter congregatus]QDE28772.1 efflux RND transporter periplasmic adaptor subunit [Paremcibacter congregatus]
MVTLRPARLIFPLLFSLMLQIPPVQAQQGSQPVPSVVVTKAKISDVGLNIRQIGRVEAMEKVDLRARVQGFLEKRPFREGSLVKQGDLLFVIEQAPYQILVDQRQADLIGAEASYKNAKADLKRYQELRKKGAASQAQLDKAVSTEAQTRAVALQAKAALRKAQLDLSYTEIKSPIGGRISRTKFSVGNLVSASDGALATVTSVDPIYVTVAVSEKNMIDARRDGIDVTHAPVVPDLILSDGSTYAHQGEFDYIDTSVNQNTDTLLVRARFPNPDGILLPGQFVHVQITGRTPTPAITVPQSTIQQDRTGYFLLVITDQNKVEMRRITVGQVIDNDWIVTSGIAAGERVVLEGLQKVRVDQTVTVVEQ